MGLSQARRTSAQRQRWTEFVKRGVVQILPPSPLLTLRRLHAFVATRSARKSFESASETAEEWLGRAELEFLQGEYPPPPDYGYEAVDYQRRARDRSRGLIRLLEPPLEHQSVLELGCADAMVCAALQQRGLKATAVDRSSRLFDERARRLGVKFVEADAANLPLVSEQFDLVFSYNSFEHLERPDAALREAIRVTKIGGLIYLLFGPLYASPFGLHAAHSITVPYCQFLFRREVLDRYVEDNRLGAIPYDTLNQWSLTRFRDLWERSSACLDRVVYREAPAVHGVELIARYPGCFRNSISDFDNLLIGTIEAAFRKTRSESVLS